MEHFYQNIDGWFDYLYYYKQIISKLPNNAKIVEIGAFRGKSTSGLAIEIINSGKNISLDVIDTWKGSVVEGDGNNDTIRIMNTIGGSNGLYYDFLKNLLPIVKYLDIAFLRLDSNKAHLLYEDKSLDFIFIDGDHSYECVSKDIKNWFPKLKTGGIIAGHDYQHPPVKKAVEELLSPINTLILHENGNLTGRLGWEYENK